MFDNFRKKTVWQVPKVFSSTEWITPSFECNAGSRLKQPDRNCFHLGGAFCCKCSTILKIEINYHFNNIEKNVINSWLQINNETRQSLGSVPSLSEVSVVAALDMLKYVNSLEFEEIYDYGFPGGQRWLAHHGHRPWPRAACECPAPATRLGEQPAVSGIATGDHATSDCRPGLQRVYGRYWYAALPLAQDISLHSTVSRSLN